MTGEYRLVNFGEICEHSAFGPRFSSNEYAIDGNVACLRTTDMDFSGRINFDAMPLAKLDLSRVRNHILRRDVLVMTRTGAYLGKAAVFSQFRLPVLAGAFSIYFRLKREIACPIFVRYFFNSSVGQVATRSIATGSAQPNLNIPLLHSVPVPLPPLPTQRKIASILSAYDDLIENNTRRIAILEEMAQAIYREWFVNFRFPGHENVKLVDSPLGQIPEGWEATTVGDLAVNERRSVKPREVDPETPYLGLEHIPRKSITVTSQRTLKVRSIVFVKGTFSLGRYVRTFTKWLSPLSMESVPRMPLSSFHAETTTCPLFCVA
ncbi:MAG: restriction endonuclease subunit S [Planctomycetia bacterium]|nr:restriction endonuclease subunit S [Planctomycetia bacterium]